MMLSLCSKNDTRLEVYDAFNYQDSLCFRVVEHKDNSDYPKYFWLSKKEVGELVTHLIEVIKRP